MKRLVYSVFAVTLLTWVGCATHTPRESASSSPLPSTFAPLPEAVTSFGAVSEEGWLYICGGHRGERHDYNAQEVSGSFYRLSLVDGNTWQKLPSAEPAQGAPLVARGGVIYRIGGMAAQNRKGEKQDLQSKSLVARFDPVRSRWEQLTPLPSPRSSHDAAVVGNKLYVGGGWQLNGGTNKPTWHDTMLVLDLARRNPQWESIPQPFQRRALSVAALGSRIYFLGGMDSNNKTSEAVDVFDTKTGAWAKGPDLPAGPMKGFGSSSIAQAGRLYWSGMKGELHRLSDSGDSWELVGKLAHPRFFHRLVPVGSNQLLVAGGENSEGKRNDLELLTPSFNALGTPPAERSQPQNAALPLR